MKTPETLAWIALFFLFLLVVEVGSTEKVLKEILGIMKIQKAVFKNEYGFDSPFESLMKAPQRIEEALGEQAKAQAAADQFDRQCRYLAMPSRIRLVIEVPPGTPIEARAPKAAAEAQRIWPGFGTVEDPCQHRHPRTGVYETFTFDVILVKDPKWGEPV